MNGKQLRFYAGEMQLPESAELIGQLQELTEGLRRRLEDGARHREALERRLKEAEAENARLKRHSR